MTTIISLYKLPVRVESSTSKDSFEGDSFQYFLVDANSELIFSTYDASSHDMKWIADMINREVTTRIK